MAYILRKYNGDAGHAGFQSQTAGGTLRRHGLSRIFHLPSRKKKDNSDIPSRLPTCEESVHYPVFNPRDPRHNPLATTKPWSTKARYAQIPSHLKPAQWGQVLPKGPLRKTRSSLMTAPAGVHNPSIRLERCLSDSHPARSDLSNRSDAFVTSVSETSTEEDPDFGFDIHRTSCNLGQLSHITTQDSSNLSSLKSYPSTIRLSPRIPARDAGHRYKSTYLNPKKSGQNENQMTNGYSHRTAEKAQETKWVDGHIMTPTRINGADTVRDIRPAENLIRVNRVRLQDTFQDLSGCSTEVGIPGSSGDGYLTLPGDSSSKLLDVTTELARIRRETSVSNESQSPAPHPDPFRNHTADRTTMLTVASASNASSGSRSNMHKLPSYETTSALSIAAPKYFC